MTEVTVEAGLVLVFIQQRAQIAEIRAKPFWRDRGIFRRVSVFTPTVDLLGQINLVVLLGYGGHLVATGRLTLGDLIVFAGLLQQFAGQVTNLANSMMSGGQSGRT